MKTYFMYERVLTYYYYSHMLINISCLQSSSNETLPSISTACWIASQHSASQYVISLLLTPNDTSSLTRREPTTQKHAQGTSGAITSYSVAFRLLFTGSVCRQTEVVHCTWKSTSAAKLLIRHLQLHETVRAQRYDCRLDSSQWRNQFTKKSSSEWDGASSPSAPQTASQQMIREDWVGIQKVDHKRIKQRGLQLSWRNFKVKLSTLLCFIFPFKNVRQQMQKNWPLGLFCGLMINVIEWPHQEVHIDRAHFSLCSVIHSYKKCFYFYSWIRSYRNMNK